SGLEELHHPSRPDERGKQTQDVRCRVDQSALQNRSQRQRKEAGGQLERRIVPLRRAVQLVPERLVSFEGSRGRGPRRYRGPPRQGLAQGRGGAGGLDSRSTAPTRAQKWLPRPVWLFAAGHARLY